MEFKKRFQHWMDGINVWRNRLGLMRKRWRRDRHRTYMNKKMGKWNELKRFGRDMQTNDLVVVGNVRGSASKKTIYGPGTELKYR